MKREEAEAEAKFSAAAIASAEAAITAALCTQVTDQEVLLLDRARQAVREARASAAKRAAALDEPLVLGRHVPGRPHA